jgi:hypothetical protein
MLLLLTVIVTLQQQLNQPNLTQSTYSTYRLYIPQTKLTFAPTINRVIYALILFT